MALCGYNTNVLCSILYEREVNDFNGFPSLSISVDKKQLTDGADEIRKKNSRAKISLQVSDNDGCVELLQIVVRPVRVDLSTLHCLRLSDIIVDIRYDTAMPNVRSKIKSILKI